MTVPSWGRRTRNGPQLVPLGRPTPAQQLALDSRPGVIANTSASGPGMTWNESTTGSAGLRGPFYLTRSSPLHKGSPLVSRTENPLPTVAHHSLTTRVAPGPLSPWPFHTDQIPNIIE
jgi:hypothetical protein